MIGNIANGITLLRIFIIPFFIFAILSYHPSQEFWRLTALGIFLFAVFSDLIDGFVARRQRQKTATGRFLDPLADKLLLVSAFVCLYQIGGKFFEVRLPFWVLVVFISRDTLLLLGALALMRMKGKIPIGATGWGKASTFFQYLTVVTILLQWPQAAHLWHIAVLLAVLSGLDYIRLAIISCRRPVTSRQQAVFHP